MESTIAEPTFFKQEPSWANVASKTSGGRVLGVTAAGPGPAGAMRNAYSAVDKISFDGAHWRRDIGAKGLKRW